MTWYNKVYFSLMLQSNTGWGEGKGALLHTFTQGSKLFLSNGTTALLWGGRVLHGNPCIHLAEEGETGGWHGRLLLVRTWVGVHYSTHFPLGRTESHAPPPLAWQLGTWSLAVSPGRKRTRRWGIHSISFGKWGKLPGGVFFSTDTWKIHKSCPMKRGRKKWEGQCCRHTSKLAWTQSAENHVGGDERGSASLEVRKQVMAWGELPGLDQAGHDKLG